MTEETQAALVELREAFWKCETPQAFVTAQALTIAIHMGLGVDVAEAINNLRIAATDD